MFTKMFVLKAQMLKMHAIYQISAHVKGIEVGDAKSSCIFIRV